MKSSMILASLCASMALAKPVKRDAAIATEVVIEYYTVTVTGTGPSPTATTAQSDSGAFFSAAAQPDVAASQPTADAAPVVSTPDYSGLSDYAQPILQAHNIHRANHSASPLEWDDQLASIAQTIGQSCVYAHNTAVGGISYGQNIGAGYDDNQVAGMITDGMYNDEMANFQYYGQAQPGGDFASYGHFTQIVWAGTQKVGCATVHCPGGLANAGGMLAAFTVCNYSPAGNVQGGYADNVHPPQGQPYVSR